MVLSEAKSGRMKKGSMMCTMPITTAISLLANRSGWSISPISWRAVLIVPRRCSSTSQA